MTTTTKNTAITCKTTEIVFRNKFNALLNDQNRDAIMRVTKQFLNLNAEAAFKALWSLTYDPTYQFNKFELTEDLLPQENAIPLRNELRYQYGRQHPGFLDVDVPQSCRDAFETLKNKADPIVATAVYQKCMLLLYLGSQEIERTLFLLSQPSEQFYCGGIRSMDFTYAATTYLKPYHTQIHDLLSAMWEEKLQINASAECSNANKPFAHFDTLVKESGMELVLPAKTQDTSKPQVKAELPVEDEGKAVYHSTTSGHGHLTAEEILAHAKYFSTLLSSDVMPALFILRDAGFDLNEIIEKEVTIRSLLQIASDLSI